MKVCTFGELLLRLSPPAHQRFTQARSFDAAYGGAEANVAISLAHFGLDSYYLSKLPAHALGQAVINYLRQFGVHTKFVARGGDRLGLYFLECGASQRPSSVIYDRAGSAICGMQPDEIDWMAAFDEARWFHWTGITPALGDAPRTCLEKACGAAHDAGATISCDLNFRSKLWSSQEAQEAMIPLMDYVDVCIAGRGDAQTMLGVTPSRPEDTALDVDEAFYVELAEVMKSEFDFEAVAITLRESHSVSRHGWSALLLDERECASPYCSRRYNIEIVDRVGGGDAFSAGLIHGLLTKPNTRDALDFAAAAACLKHSIPGDANLVTAEEVEQLARGDGSGRVNR